MSKGRSIGGLVACVCVYSAFLMAQTATKIIDNGPDGEKLVFVVLGDGYALADQEKFKTDVDRLLVQGVFAHDFYRDNVKAFNVYRVDLVSNQSGVSSPTFKKNTALKVIYSGRWDRCWLEESKDTDSLITNAIKVSKYDFVLVMANENGYGGCRRSSRLYVTSGDPWDVVAHEYGHGIAGLYDEYSVPGKGNYTGDPLNNNNCSVVKDRSNVVWSTLIDANIDIPSDQARNIDSNDTVGEFTGCNYAEKGIYRPVRDCRMNSNTPHFCPVCLSLMQDAVKGFLGPPSGGQGAPPSQGAGPVGSANVNAAPQITKFVNLIVRLDVAGKVKIQKATETTGRLAVAPNASPAFFGALTENNQPGIASLVEDDPYIIRGFVDPDRKEQGEKVDRGKEATVILHLPQASLESAVHQFGLQFYSVRAGHVSTVTPSELLNIGEVVAASSAIVKEAAEISQKQLGKKVNAAAAAATK